MELKKLVIKNRTVKVTWMGESSDPGQDTLDKHTVEKVVRPHPDLFRKLAAMVPHLLVSCDMKSGNYTISQFDRKDNEGVDSFKINMTRLLDDGKVNTFALPWLPIENIYVSLVSGLSDEANKFVNENKNQLSLELKTEEQKKKGPGPKLVRKESAAEAV